MNLTKLRKEMKHMASELTGRLQYSPELYRIQFDVEDGKYIMWDYNNKRLLEYDMDSRNRESEPILTLYLDGYHYTSSIVNKKPHLYKGKFYSKYEDMDWDEFVEVYNKLNDIHQI